MRNGEESGLGSLSMIIAGFLWWDDSCGDRDGGNG